MPVFMRSLEGYLFLDIGSQTGDPAPANLKREMVVRKYFEGDDGAHAVRYSLPNAIEEFHISESAEKLLREMEFSSSDFDEDIKWDTEGTLTWYGSAGTMFVPSASRLGKGTVLPEKFNHRCSNTEEAGDGNIDRAAMVQYHKSRSRNG